MQFIFIVRRTRALPKYIETKYWPLAFTKHRAFWKIKKRSVTVFPTLISAWFFKKYFTLLSINWHYILATLSGWLLFLDKLGNMCITITCLPVYGSINFKINLSFLIKRFPAWPKKSGQKTLRMKRAFKMKLAFLIIFKGFPWLKQKQLV